MTVSTRTDAPVPTWRRLPIGVELAADGGGHARVWAPIRQRVELVLYSGDEREASAIELEREPEGYFSGHVPALGAGTLYRFRLDGGDAYPDPASRAQPRGPHGPSQVIDPRAYAWRDTGWKGVRRDGQVIYELHIGTFTPDGTFPAAVARLEKLAGLGVTILEVMPVAEFPGRFGWGYDGVDLFAPTRLYGAPDDFRAFVDRAHQLGMGVILDVVYNHLGPDGNYLKAFAPQYFKGTTEWGEAFNFDGDDSGPVRELFVANAGYWIDEFHLDGLRLDATQQVFDRSATHVLGEVCARVQEAAAGRGTLVVGENEPQDVQLLRARDQGGCAIDALWNDDFHHSAWVAATGNDEAYYGGYRGSAQELLSCAKWGYLYQGTWYGWQQGRRGTPALDLEPERFVTFVQNHDQVANSATGKRLHQVTSPGRWRAVMGLLLLMPQTPMLFMGDEFAASAPFLYFADHAGDLGRLVRQGRGQFLSQFPSVATPETTARLADPGATATFERCKLDWREWDAHGEAVALVRDLLRLRRDDPTLRAQGRGARLGAHGVDGAVFGDDTFVMRRFGAAPDGAGDRLVVVNLARRRQLDPVAEPLLAPPADARWRVGWSSEDVRYGGVGTPTVDADDGGWWLPAESTVLLVPVPRAEAPAAPRPKRYEREKREPRVREGR